MFVSVHLPLLASHNPVGSPVQVPLLVLVDLVQQDLVPRASRVEVVVDESNESTLHLAQSREIHVKVVEVLRVDLPYKSRELSES